jgi:hypothetical protein
MSEYPLLDLQSIPSLVSSVDRASVFVKVIPSIAETILKETNYVHQRPQNRTKKTQLESAMNDGSFEPVATLVFCVQGINVDLVNGQHTLAAMVETNSTYVLPIQIYNKKAENLYPKIDRGKPRSLSDAIRSNQTASLMYLSDAATEKVARGVKVILNGHRIKATKHAPISEDILLETMVGQYKEAAARFYVAIDHLEYAKKLTAQIPMSLFLTLYTSLEEEDFDKVDEFAYGCASNIGLAEGDPRRLVYTMYAEFVRWGGQTMRGKRITRHEEIAILLGCWNNWHNGKSRLIRYRTKELVSILEKSPNVNGTTITYKV